MCVVVYASTRVFASVFLRPRPVSVSVSVFENAVVRSWGWKLRKNSVKLMAASIKSLSGLTFSAYISLVDVMFKASSSC